MMMLIMPRANDVRGDVAAGALGEDDGLGAVLLLHVHELLGDEVVRLIPGDALPLVLAAVLGIALHGIQQAVLVVRDLGNVQAAHAQAAERAEFGRWKTSCALVVERAGLSNRETEVFMLLAKGRGTEHIQNKLGISGHTVKTHTYNIYHKMGIGSREELLDAVENALEDDAR